MDTLRDNPPIRPGDVLGGKFRIERVLGEGGMGVVAAATHLQLGQLVALKFMLPIAMRHKENVQRFEREAQAAVRLRSEHVARVMDVGHLETGAPYIVMEYLEGEDLDALVERGPLPVHTAVDYVLQTCEAVAEAHALGIVHRDLKPKNLFLTRRVSGKPLVKVLDFGISKSTTDNLSLTSTQQGLGSPNYMSPEQLRCARDVDQRTDIWSLGVILYELLTARVPFEAESVTHLTALVLQEQPRPLEEHRPDVPPALAAIVARCLEKSPHARFQSVLELAEAIAPFASPDGAHKAKELLGAPMPLSSSQPISQPIVGGPEPTSVRILAPHSSTNSAWDRTQLAPGGSSKKLVIGLAAALVAVTAIAGVAIVRLRATDAAVVGSQPIDPPASVAPPASSPSLEVLPPTATVVSAPPASGTPTTARTVRPPQTAPVATTPRGKPDAGAAILALPVLDAGAPPVSTQKGFVLPTSRN